MPEAAIGADKSRREADKAETARHVIRAVVTISEGNRGPILEMCAQISRRLKWVGVGRHSFKYATGRLELPISGKAPLTYGKIIDYLYLSELLLRFASLSEMGDIRVLTLKVALMDMQREPSEPGQGRTCRSVISSTCQVWATGTTTQSLLTVRLSSTWC